jgi:hypothetical protein
MARTAADLSDSRGFGGGDKKNTVSLMCLLPASHPTVTSHRPPMMATTSTAMTHRAGTPLATAGRPSQAGHSLLHKQQNPERHMEGLLRLTCSFFFFWWVVGCFSVIQTTFVTRYIMAWVVIVVFSYDNLCQLHDQVVTLFLGGRCQEISEPDRGLW